MTFIPLSRVLLAIPIKKSPGMNRIDRSKGAHADNAAPNRTNFHSPTNNNQTPETIPTQALNAANKLTDTIRMPTRAVIILFMEIFILVDYDLIIMHPAISYPKQI